MHPGKYKLIKNFTLALTKNFFMKKIFFAALAGLLCFCISCNDAGTSNKGSDAQQKNIASADAIGKAFETGDVSKMDSVIADDFVDHTDHGDIKGRDSLKAMVNMIHSTFKDMKMEKLNEVGDDNYVYTWMRYSGTSEGQMGMPKGPYDMKGIELTKFKDGKAVEHWGFMDMQDMAKMMPQPAMNNMNKMDSSKMKK